MKHYAPIAVYCEPEDIIQMFPNTNDDEARQIISKGIVDTYLAGRGKPHIIEEPDEESVWSRIEMDEWAGKFYYVGEDFAVTFTEGEMLDGKPYGYYIDIYKVIPEDADEITISDDQLKAMSKERRKTDEKIKLQIIKEFKNRFKEEGEGLDFFANSFTSVYGMGEEACGDISRLYLNEDGDIMVTLTREFLSLEEEFESRYFACEDWPMLLVMVRDGIRKEWFIEED